jgi:signal transduction histidine kinase
VGEGISGTVVQSGASKAVPDVAEEPAYVVFNGRVRSELVAPITYDREVIGFLDVESFEEGRFREEDEEVVTFLEALANQAAIAIKAAQLRREAMESLGASMAIDPRLSMEGLQDLLIDELRHKNEQLAATNDRLEAANRSKSEFLAHMSHDLRGPLNVIVGLSELLGDPSVAATLDDAKRRESLELIRSNGAVLSALIGNVLDLSVVEAGKAQLDAAPFEAAPAFEYLSAVARTLAAEACKEIDVRVTIDPAVSTIRADEDKFLRIMTNLVSNAVKFTPSGGHIAITVAPDDLSAGAGRSGLHIAVADSGSGIAPADHERIFEPFQQIPDAVYRQRHGTGLGLTVVRQFVELHGGHVYVESALGQGSTFHVVLPDALGHDPVAVASVDMPAPEQGAASASGAPLRVLVVEDTPAHVEVMRLALASRGHTVASAARGEEALAWIAAQHPDVILLDMQLPDLDGFSIAEQLKRRVETHAIPIIAVTADALSVTEERALASGCDAYLTKPIDVALLLETIDRVTRWPPS